MTFQDYCEEFLDQDISLMSAQQKQDAYNAYVSKASKKDVTVKHADAHLKLVELISKTQRLIASQKIAIERAKIAGLNADLAIKVVTDAEILLSKRAKKSELLDLITANSEASRALNNQLIAN